MHLSVSDPYVKVNMLYHGNCVSKWKSTVKKNTLSPVYNESFHFQVNHLEIAEATLQVTVMNSDRIGRSHPIGVVLIGNDVLHSESGQKHWREMLRSPNKAVSRWHSLSPAT